MNSTNRKKSAAKHIVLAVFMVVLSLSSTSGNANPGLANFPGFPLQTAGLSDSDKIQLTEWIHSAYPKMEFRNFPSDSKVADHSSKTKSTSLNSTASYGVDGTLNNRFLKHAVLKDETISSIEEILNRHVKKMIDQLVLHNFQPYFSSPFNVSFTLLKYSTLLAKAKLNINWHTDPFRFVSVTLIKKSQAYANTYLEMNLSDDPLHTSNKDSENAFIIEGTTIHRVTSDQAPYDFSKSDSIDEQRLVMVIGIRKKGEKHPSKIY